MPRENEPPPRPLKLPDGSLAYEVESVVGIRKTEGGKSEYLVKWVGYPSNQNSWIEEENLPAYFKDNLGWKYSNPTAD